MRIAYVCYWSVYRLDGVARKITTQVGRWRGAGHEVAVFALTPAARGREQRWAARAYEFSSLPGRIPAAARLLRELRAYAPDVVYLRYELLPPPLQLLPRRYPTVVELNSDEHAEYRFRPGRRAALADRYGRWNWRALFGPAAGIVCVTHELVGLVDELRRPTITIANGIDLEAIAPLPAPQAGRPTLAFAGTPGQAWHGVDKLLDLAAARPELDVILIGPEPRGPALPNVEQHPHLPREEYLPLLARADAALGTAAFHRNGMEEGAPLKVREYLACGLPIVVPYEDTDLADLDEWFVLRLPNEERNLVEHAGEILEFVRGVRGRRVPRAAIERRIGAAAKEERRLAFLESLVRA